MFAEELGGNTNRRKQEEQRRRRRQAKLQKKKEELKKAEPEDSLENVSVPAATSPLKPSQSTSSEPAGSKPTAVSNALQLRAERQVKQKLDETARKIQSFYRMHRSNSNELTSLTKTLEKHFADLEKLQLLLRKNASHKTYVPPAATITVLCRQLLFVTMTFSYKNRTRSVSIRNSKVTSQLLKKAVELVFLPGMFGTNDSPSAFSEWMQSLRGQIRLQNLLRLCLCALTSSCEREVRSVCSEFLLSIMTPDTGNSGSSDVQGVCRGLLLTVAAPRLISRVENSNFWRQMGTPLDMISILRNFLLFSTGDAPIPSLANDIGESCIKPEERDIASCLMHTVLEAAVRANDSERNSLLQRLLREIFTIPLLSWRVTADCLLFKDSVDQTKLLVSTMIQAFTDRFSDALNAGKIQSLFPDDVPLSVCNATPVQSLLANLLQIANAFVGFNGMDVSKLDFPMSTSLYEFVAMLIDTTPLGTLATKDSVVEWFSDAKGRETCVLLSPVVLRQCRMVLSSSFVRRLFLCAIDEEILKTKAVLSLKTQKDLKHEKELEEGGSSAVYLAAKEAKIDHSKSFWKSSAWSKKVSSGVSKILTGDTAGRKGHLPAKQASTKQPPTNHSNSAAVGMQQRSNYSPALLIVLCRLYGIVIARWGGFGGEDTVRRVQEEKSMKSRPVATRAPDVCTQSLLNVICFSTSVTETTWGMLQGEINLTESVGAVVSATKENLPLRCLSIRPYYGRDKKIQTRKDAVALLFLFVSSLCHTLIITDDTEIHEMEKPLPLHQLRRCAELLKQLLYRASCVDDVGNSSTSVFQSDYFGLALINTAGKTMRDLYDRSSRRPISTPKLWLVEDLLEREIKRSKTEQDFVELLSSPVLRICPFLVSFKRRLRLFDRIIYKNRSAIQGENTTNIFHSNPLKPGIPVRITRGRILEDGLKTMNNLGTNMRQRIAVQYYNEAGIKEVGIDAGGLFKEFWTDLSAIAFDPNYSLFCMTEDNCMYPSPLSRAAHGHDHLVLFEFLGRILGKALYEGITIQPQFAHFFLSFLRGGKNYFHMLSDLSTIDRTLHNNIMFLKTYENEAEDLCLTFSIANDDFGENKEINLIPNGSEILVTNDNKHRYIGLFAKYYVNDRVKDQCEAVKRGLFEVLDASWLRIFNEPELQVLISGTSNGELDISDLKSNCRYTGGFTSIDPNIARFWKVVSSFSTDEQASLLRFVTSCERPPPLGFSSMNPPFTIQRVGILRDSDKLPTSSTCFNVLKLPTYSSQKVMKERLLFAIRSGAGFELA